MHPSEEIYPWISVGAVAWGLLDCFFGYRVFKVTLALLGGFIGAYLAQQGGLALELGPDWLDGIMIVGALLGAGLAFLVYVAAVFVAGFGFGATLGIMLLAHLNHLVALLCGCVIGIVGGFLAVGLQRVLITLSTALVGSFRAVLALSFFTSQLDWVFYFRQPQQIPALIDNTPWMYPAILGLAAVGVIAQLELGGSSTKKKTGGASE